jgi:RNA polymerase-binding transcription factor DksA
MVASSEMPRQQESSTTSRDPAIDSVRTLLSEAETELGAIEQAIERLARGTYATCDLCGAPIEPERLAAVPTERTCAAHGVSD